MAFLLRIDTHSPVPLYRQIVEELRRRIDAGDLPDGYRLPGSRKLARQLGVDRSTVYKAYQELWALGYLESEPGSSSRVRRRLSPAAGTGAPASSRIDWQGRGPEAFREAEERYRAEESSAAARRARAADACSPGEEGKQGHGKPIDFTPLAPDRRHFPAEEFRSCLNTVLAQEGPELLGYGDPQGLAALRASIAERLRLHAIHVSPEELLITAGAQNGLELIMKSFAAAPAGIAMEEPSYSRAAALARSNGLRVQPVHMGPAGMDLAELERVIETAPPALVYTIPNFHNPTGITTDQAHREALLRLCTAHRIPIVEDGFEEELKYFGTSILPIKSMDSQGIVLYLGTFSKVLFPGLRIGWIAAPQAAIERLRVRQKFAMLCSSPADQAALELFCRRGFYDRHMRRMQRIYRGRMQTALRCLRQQLSPELATWHSPQGGYTIWLEIQGCTGSEARIVKHCAERGVLVSPGSEHSLDGAAGRHLRISLGETDEEEIRIGIRRLAGALAELQAEELTPPGRSAR
jgi:GntR family transcriptional regulator/MocR family aminotransferase